MTRMIARLVAMAMVSLVASLAFSSGASAAKGKKTLRVCEHGCKYSNIQKAVQAVKKKKLNAKKTTIKVKPGTYKGARFTGQKYNGLTITGTGDSPEDVVLDGGCEPPDLDTGPGCGNRGQNGIEAIRVSRLKLLNMTAQHFPINGFYVHSFEGHDKDCNGYTMRNLVAAHNRDYGLFALHCIGGRIKNTVGYGHGDSAIYIGQTPPQKKKDRKWTDISGNEAYLNVLGYSGTNSKYVNIHDNYFFNNGIGIVPNTLDSELFEPTKTGVIEDNDIFWNNFNHYLPGSPVKTSQGGGEGTNWYPTGVGISMFGSDGWVVENNDVFGHFMWGVASFSDPFNDGDDAINQNNQYLDNRMGRAGTDTNNIDFWNDGSGSGNCWSGNLAGNPETTDDVTFGISPESENTQEFLYPTCPAPDEAGTGSSFGDLAQLGDLVAFTTAFPPCHQEDFWGEAHAHPAFEDFEPYEQEGECPE
jgi:hypothetical protein